MGSENRPFSSGREISLEIFRQGCQMVYDFQAKNSNLDNFGLAMEVSVYIFYGHLVYFMDWTLGLFHGHLVYFTAIWYTF
jgi:hypothetical protein